MGTKQACRIFAFALLCSLLGGACGSGAGQDEGLVFSATGIWRGPESITEDKITCTEVNLSNAIVDASYPLQLDLVEFFPDRNNPVGDPCGAYLGLENRLTEMAINVESIQVRYEIPADPSNHQLPDHLIRVGFQVREASSTVASPSGQPNLVYAEMVGQFLPESLLDLLRDSENEFPARPFLLNAFMRATGQAENGSRYRTNEVGYTFAISD